MTNREFSDEFDVLYNSITSNQAPGLDEYEKSVFLTKAQDEIIKSYFNPRLNKTQQGFDGSERRQIDFSMIMKSKVYNSLTAPGGSFGNSFFDSRSNTKSVVLDDDVLMIVNEYVNVFREGRKTFTRLTVVPVNNIEYARLMSRPYKRPLKNQAWRILDTVDNHKRAELIIGPDDVLNEYVIRYVRRPRPIRLTTFNDVTIGASDSDEGKGEQTCELDPILHPEILQRAVELAKAVYMGDLSSQLALGQSSHTEMGAIQSRE